MSVVFIIFSWSLTVIVLYWFQNKIGLAHREDVGHHLHGDAEEHLRERDGGHQLLRDTAKGQDRIEGRVVEIESVVGARKVVSRVIVAVGKIIFKSCDLSLRFSSNLKKVSVGFVNLIIVSFFTYIADFIS